MRLLTVNWINREGSYFNMDKIIIRKATIKDLADIQKLNLKLLKNEYKNFDKTINLRWPFKEDKKALKNIIIKNDGFAEVIENKGKIIGLLYGSKGSKLPSYRKNLNYGILNFIFVEKEFRNKGFGNKLINNFKKWGKKNKFAFISVTAHAKNDKAINLYRKLGFKDYELILEKKLK